MGGVMTHGSVTGSEKKVFEPSDVEQLLLGWLLHAHKGRQRHDEAARRLDRDRLWLGGIAAVLSAVVGTSVFTSLGKEAPMQVRVVVGAIAIVAAILTGLNGFLNLSERTEKHRVAGVKYKMVIRDLERLLSGTADYQGRDDQTVVAVQKRLDELEETAPVVSEKLFEQIDDEWSRRGAEFIGRASDLYQHTS